MLVFGVGGKDWVLVVKVVVCGMEECVASHVKGVSLSLSVRCWGKVQANLAITVTEHTSFRLLLKTFSSVYISTDR